jgi:DNA-binding CsgD family transcriptional regulator
MPLLERDSYLDLLSASLDRVSSEAGWVVLIAGEAGIGKTSLIRQFTTAPNKAARVLWGGCEALFTPHPLAPLHDIARQIGGEFPAAISSAPSRHAVFNATLDRFSRLPAPTVVIIEDVHWADEATLDLIKFLGRRLRRLGLLLVISYRDDEVNDKHPLSSVIGDLPPRSVSRIELPPLSRAAIGLLAAAAGRSLADLPELTCGNPFFVTEILATSENKIPSTIRDSVNARTARLSDGARRVAQLVAIVPGKAERWLVEGTLAPGGAALQECLNAGMIALADGSLGFRHELARRAAEDSIPLTERQDLNACVLAALLGQGEDKVAIARLVHHADCAADSEAVLRFAPLAAERAAAVGAHREAVLHLATALRHGASLADEDRAQLLERLSYECYLTDRVAEAIGAREASLALWQSIGSRSKEGDCLRWLSRLSWFNGQTAAAESYAMAAVEVLEPLPPGRELAMAYSNRAQLHMLAEEAAPALAWGHKALALATAVGETEIECHALINIGSVRLARQEQAGRQDLELALEMALAGGFEEHAARAFSNLSSISARHRDIASATSYLEAGIAYCEEHDLDSWARYMTALSADISLAAGRWNEVSRDAESVIGHPSAAAINKIPALTALGRLRTRRGDPDFETPLAQAHRLAVPTNEPQRLGPVLAARAEAAWLHGTGAPEVLSSLAEAYDAALKWTDPWIRGELAFWLWRHGRLTGPPRAVARPFALQIAGDWRAAAGTWEEIGCPYERAMALADSDEEAPLRDALEISERLGAAPMAAILRRKLRARGVRGIPRGAQERTRRNPRGMTNRELKVLSQLVEGRRNAEIARRLFVSEKTVDHHVSAILAKLDVCSRGEAAAAAMKLGLFQPQIAEQAAKK